MGYFPSDIPFMSEEELKENGIKIPKDNFDPYLPEIPPVSREEYLKKASFSAPLPGPFEGEPNE